METIFVLAKIIGSLAKMIAFSFKIVWKCDYDHLKRFVCDYDLSSSSLLHLATHE